MIPPYSPFLPIQHPEDLLDNLAERRQSLVREFERDRENHARLSSDLETRRGRVPVLPMIAPLLAFILRTLNVS